MLGSPAKLINPVSYPRAELSETASEALPSSAPPEARNPLSEGVLISPIGGDVAPMRKLHRMGYLHVSLKDEWKEDSK
jgi:hypothetical protein